jgi:peptidoglycan lytic transglycosylase G
LSVEAWGPEDPLLNPDDPDAAAREQRRREREARRRGREGTQPASEPEPPGASAAEPSGRDSGEAVPPPRQRRLPSSPGREPFAQRVAAMRKRLSRSDRPQGSSPPPPPRRLSGPGKLLGGLIRDWRFLAGVLVGVLILWFLIALFQPFHGSGGKPVVVTIPRGASASEVGDLLDNSGVVSSSAMFQIRVTLAGKRSDLLPGTYTLNENESYGDAIADLTTPAQQRSTVTVTIPEGLSREQIAPLARQAGLSGSYVKASVRSQFLNPDGFGAQGRARNLEGFLFPDTYQVKARVPVSDLVQVQLQNFKARLNSVNMKYARSKNLTIYDVLIIASMIEREVQVPRERRLVAAVIYNRLHDGMPLGIDATTRFAVGNYTTPLTPSQLSSPSPYNTRLHPGLPPGPIGNPGLAAIEAAARPAKVDYLFYVVKPGSCGEHNFSSTDAQFARDRDAYQQALEAKGSSPTSC